MSKKTDILNANKPTEYDLNDEEKLQVASLIALIEQARQAQDILYSTIVNGIAQRLEVADKDLSLNFEEMLANGVKTAKLTAK